MRKQILAVVSLCWMIGLAVSSAWAQPGTVAGVTAKIPFSFTVAGKTLPAGEYTMMVGPHQVKIRDAKGKGIGLVFASEISGRSVDVNGQIVFHCYGKECFLSEVWTPTQENGLLLNSRAERELAKKENGKSLAVLGVEPQKVAAR